ncbi:MAG: ATP-binding protein [Desulfocapsaceae bacterium]|nr:ATP-binding protein [Desulfocapsaceae bacterium]
MTSPVNTSPFNKNLATLTHELGSNLYLYQILEETPNGVMVVNFDHQVLYANPAATKFLGAIHRGLTGSDLHSALGHQNGEMYRRIKEFIKKPEKQQDLRFREEIQIETGESETQILDAVLVYPPSSPGYYLLYLIDITTRKTLEGKLRRRNAFFHNLIESSVDGIIASDMKGNLIIFNQSAQDLLGYDNVEKFKLHVTGLYNPGMAKTILRRMRSDDYGGKGKLRHQELIVKNKHGTDIPVNFSGGIIYDDDQEIATFGIFTDLRAMLRIEEDLEQTHKMLMQSEKMAGLGRLAAGVAHEINNPMSGIMLYSNLIKEDLGDEHPATEDLQTIINEAERCKVIVADLLEFSHQKSYEMALIDINEVIGKTLTVVHNQPLFQNIQINRELDQNLPPIFGNTIRLNQVILNIVVNAAQAMNGKGTLDIISRTRANHDINEVIISDTGPGIEKEVIDQIFEPFFTTKSTGEGTGLGLSVSYAIVKEHKGSIRVTSEPGQGSTFTLRFPAVMENLIGEANEH